MKNTTTETRESPLCPECGSEKVGFIDTNELKCQCGHLFEPPEHMKGKGTPKSKQEPQGVVSEETLQRAKVGDPPRIPFFKDLESTKEYFWKAQEKELKRLEREVKIIRKEREPIHAKVEALQIHPYEELKNYTVNARTRVPEPGGLPDRLIAASFSEKSYWKLKSKLAELDQQIEDKEAAINAIRSFGIIHDFPGVKVQIPDRPENWEDEESFPRGHKITDAARLLRVDRGTIYNWIKAKPKKIHPSQNGRIPISEIKRLRRGNAPVIE